MLSFYQFISRHPMRVGRHRGPNHFSEPPIEEPQKTSSSSSSSMTTAASEELPVHALLDPTQRPSTYVTTFPEVKLETLDLPALKADVRRKRKVMMAAETPIPLPDTPAHSPPNNGDDGDDEAETDTPFPAGDSLLPQQTAVDESVSSSSSQQSNPSSKRQRKSAHPKKRITPTLVITPDLSSKQTTSLQAAEKTCCKSCGMALSKAFLAKREEKKRLQRAAAAQRRLAKKRAEKK
jgi:hypothetical protein